jgi:hypothetical protein
MSHYKNLITILNEIEFQSKNLNLRGFKGYGYGHPWTPRKKIGYGIVNPVEQEEKITSDFKPVKVSRAFKKEQ